MNILTLDQAKALYDQLRADNPHLPHPKHVPTGEPLDITLTPDGFTALRLTVMLDRLPEKWTEQPA